MGNILKTLTPEQVAKLSPSFVEHLNSLNLMQEIRADVLMISVNIEEQCNKIILDSFIKPNMYEDFIHTLLASEFSITFRTKTVLVAYIIKKYCTSLIDEDETKRLNKCFEKITSVRNYAAHKPWSFDENGMVYLKKITTDGIKNSMEKKYFDYSKGGLIAEFAACAADASIIMDKYFKKENTLS